MTFEQYREYDWDSPESIRRMQEELLVAHVRYCAEHSPYYREVLGRAGIIADDITLDTLQELPLTDKSDLSHDNDAFCAVPVSAVADMVQSSGTTGVPTRVIYTDNDLHRLAYNEELSFAGCGVTADDVVLLTCTMDRCFVAGLAYFLGVRRLGAASIRNGHGSLESHRDVIERMKPTVIVGVPTFLRKLGQYLQEQAAEAEDSVKRLVCIGEPIRGKDMELLKLGRDLEEAWGAKAYSTYASSELVTTFCECTAQQGGHLHPDLGILEILDDNDHRVPAGEAGEVVITPLAVEGMPFIRFKTGDISFMLDKPCSCGRVSPRLGPIIGRRKQMMKVRGTTLYPQSIYTALDEVPGVGEYYVTVTSLHDLSDELTVSVAVEDHAWDAEAIAARLQARLRVKPVVVVEPEGTVRSKVFTPASRKPIRFFDERNRS